MKRFIILLFILSCFFGSYVQSADFEANVPAIKSVVRIGESAVYPISVSNHGNAQNFNLEYFGERGFIFIKEPEFYLDENEEYSFDLTLDSTDIPSGVFIGKIVISGAKESITIPVIFEIESRVVNFDTILDISPQFSETVPGDYFKVNINVRNLGLNKGNIELEYAIKNIDGNMIVFENQTLRVESQAQVSKSFLIPDDAPLGDYLFYVIVKERETNSTGTNSVLFGVAGSVMTSPGKSIGTFKGYFGWSLFVIAVLITAFLMINYYWNNKVSKNYQEWGEKFAEIKNMKFSDSAEKMRKLEYQRSVLDKAYKAGYIQKKSFESGRKKINELIRSSKVGVKST